MESRNLKKVVILCVSLLPLFCRPADAGTGKSREKFSLSPGIGTVLPTDIEASLQARFLGYFGFEAGIGTLPSPYVDLINAISTSAGWYNDDTARIISESLDWSLILRCRLAGYPLAWMGLGLYLHLDYVLSSLGGGVSAASVFALATGREEFEQMDREIPVSSTLHNVSAGIGWFFRLPYNIEIALEISFFMCAYATSDVEVKRGRAAAGDLALAGESYLNDIYTTYFKLPVIGMHLRYGFIWPDRSRASSAKAILEGETEEEGVAVSLIQ